MYHRQQSILLIVFISSSAFIHPEVATQTNIVQQQATSAPWSSSEDSWDYWWSYSGVSGPANWGLNLDWYICDKGQRQSPIDIETKSLVYDPHLTPLRADNNLISGFLYNDGHAILFTTHLVQQQAANRFESKKNFKLQDNNSSRRKESVTAVVGQQFNLNFAQTLNPSEASGLNGLSESVKLSISQDEKLQDLSVVGGQFEKSVRSNSIVSENSETTNDESSVENLNSSDENSSTDEQVGVQFSQAGLAYPYKFELLYLRFGSEYEKKLTGSEHLINSQAFAAEVQIFAYNSAIYRSFSEASSKPHGLLSISVLIDVLENDNTTSNSPSAKHPSTATPNVQLENLLKHLKDVQHRGNSVPIQTFNLSALLPETDYFITYDGSLTTPGCYESVIWLILNKPLYITRTNLDTLRTISADENSSTPTGTLIAGNIRPPQPVNARPIRTNIKPTESAKGPETCQRLWTKYEYRSFKAVT